MHLRLAFGDMRKLHNEQAVAQAENLHCPLLTDLTLLSCCACRIAEALISQESGPDESLIAEGWIVAGTILSNRDDKPGSSSKDCLSIHNV